MNFFKSFKEKYLFSSHQNHNVMLSGIVSAVDEIKSGTRGFVPETVIKSFLRKEMEIKFNGQLREPQWMHLTLQFSKVIRDGRSDGDREELILFYSKAREL
jgi:hypothetical protein